MAKLQKLQSNRLMLTQRTAGFGPVSTASAQAGRRFWHDRTGHQPRVPSKPEQIREFRSASIKSRSSAWILS
jgi:hypothetical protein